ncbi:hypothetical protein [Rhodoferax sp. TS-BS-61-7]|uniref:hypothetical protein n=1 Tax=Rhodoferax sp. TS-BS-61-7 TaxID=2094194 RepID=UPI000CF6D3D4|nr:hypothetical protein [Rhodoferax sp. TS-BS-61-7]PQA76763.1 hypothetical protein C5F53_14885 [Rhodoferax sp. TS-BS-61-7]
MTISRDQPFSTEGLGKALFRPHGRADWRIDGDVLRTDVVGPFNRELAEAIGPILHQAYALLCAQGPCAEVVIVHGSALAGPEALTALTGELRKFVQEGLAPVGTAFVMAPEVEGSHFMPALLVQSFAHAGWPACQVFATADEAEAWVQGLLAAARA